MTDEEIDNLRKKIWELEDQISEYIYTKNCIIALSVTCILLFIGCIGIYAWGNNLKASREIYKYRLESKNIYTKNLEQQYRNLEDKYETLKLQTNTTYNYDTGKFSEKQKPIKYVDWSKVDLSNINIPETNYRYAEPYIPIKNNWASEHHIQYTDKKSTVPPYDFAKEQRERDLYELQKTVNDMKIERTLNNINGRTNPSITGWEY